MADDRVPVIDSEGRAHSLPRRQLDRLDELGLRLPDSAAELEAAKDKTKAERMWKTAAAEGLMDVGTLGLRAAWARENLSPEELAEAEARSRTGAYTAGQVGGGVGLGVGAAGLLGKTAQTAATFTPAGAVARGAQAAGSAVEGVVARRGASHLVSRGAGLAAEGTIEGAAHGAAQALTEQSLADHDVTAEKLLAGAGEGALWGGALGGALGAGVGRVQDVAVGARVKAGKVLGDLEEPAARTSSQVAWGAKSAKEAAGKAKRAVSKALPDSGLETPALIAKLSAKVSGSKDWKTIQNATSLNEQGQRIRSNFLRYNKNKEEIAKAVTNDLKLAAKHRDEISSAIAESNKSGNALPPEHDVAVKEFAGETLPTMAKFTNDAGKVDAKALENHFRGIVDPLESAEHQALLRSVQVQKKTAESLLESAGLSKSTVKKLEAARAHAAEMEDTLDRAGVAMGDAHSVQSLVEREFLGVSPGLFAGAAVGGPAVGGPAGIAGGIALGALSNPRQVVRTLGQLENINQRVNSIDRAIEKGVIGHIKQAASVTPAVLRRISAPSSEVVKASGKAPRTIAVSAAVRAFGATPEKRRKKYGQVSKSVRMFINEPHRAAEWRSRRLTAGLSDVTPATAAAIAGQHNNAIAYLASRLPVPPQHIGQSLQPHLFEHEPTDAEIEEFARYAAAVADPTSVIEDLKSGELTTEAVEAVKAVYPNVFLQMQVAAMTALSRTTKELPYETTLQLGLLLDIPAHPTLTAEFHAIHTAVMSQGMPAPEEPQAPSAPYPQSPGASDHAERAMTETEKISQTL